MSHGPRHVEVIYCDDIRQEVGNKFSFMGIYTTELTVPSPVVLPKLCIAVKVATDKDDPFESLEVRIVKGDDEIELLSTGLIPPMSADIVPQDKNSTRLIFLLTFVLAPFQIEEETIIRVKANTEREELRSTPLRIRIVPPQASPTIQ
jgi:hypothetical protein